MDILIASVGLILLFPAFILIAILIKLDSRGPVFFVQKRVRAERIKPSSKGAGAFWALKVFSMYKFRSMTATADEALHQKFTAEYLRGATGGQAVSDKIPNDPRITRIGRFLRRTSLDELPQLVNVVRGEMSLVGPRPVPVYEAAGYESRHVARLCAWPGMTCIYQVKGRGKATFEQMVNMDTQYIKTQTVWLDVKLLLLTIPAVLAGDGAE